MSAVRLVDFPNGCFEVRGEVSHSPTPMPPAVPKVVYRSEPGNPGAGWN